MLDTYLVIPEAKLKIAQEIVSQLDGTRSLAGIAGEYLERGQRVDVAGLHRSLRDAGLIVGATRTGELRRLGLHLFDIPVERLLARCATLVRSAWLPLICSTALILVCGAIAASLEARQIVSLALGRIVLAPALLYSLAVLAYAGTILWHELFHAIAALRFGLTPSRLSVIGYLVVIPMFAIRIPGIYLISPAKRICVWIAGIWGSLTLASAAALALQVAPLALPWRQFLARLALANGIIAAFNLIPFLPTDGYFILSTAARQPNIRLRAWRELKQLFRIPRKANLFLLAYIVLSGVCMALLLARNVLRLYWLAHHSAAAFAIVAVLICFGLWRALAARKVFWTGRAEKE